MRNFFNSDKLGYDEEGNFFVYDSKNIGDLGEAIKWIFKEFELKTELETELRNLLIRTEQANFRGNKVA